MRQHYPLPVREVGPFDVYGRLEGLTGGRPAVRVNMISSVDGASALDGHTGGLAGPADKSLFLALRSLADVVLVGASTARAENYGPARLSPELRARRESAGWRPVPRIAVLTRTCSLDLESRLFTEAHDRTIVITSERAAAEHRDRINHVADLVIAGEQEVSMPAALSALGELGITSVLAEGGPSVLAQLAAGDLVDELCLTLAPTMVPAPVDRIVAASANGAAVALELVHVLVGDEDFGGYLFLRYGRRRQRG
jgi:riboflavin biosynthesis pyrimidine reductase